MISVIMILVVMFSVFLGLFLCYQPLKAIEIQKRFYAMINWRIEPISLPKEIRNTRFMGLSLAIFAVLALFYALFLQPKGY